MEDNDSPTRSPPTVRKGRPRPITDREAGWSSTLDWYIVCLLVPALNDCEDVELAFLKRVSDVS